MNAYGHGYGLVVPTQRFSSRQLGNVVYIDDGGVVREVGRIFDDPHFKTIMEQNNSTGDRATIEEEYPSTAIVFSMGSIDVRLLTPEECSVYIPSLLRLRSRAVILDDENAPEHSQSPPKCAWLLTRKPGDPGPGYALTTGPGL